MKRSLKTLIGYSIEGSDGPKGKVKDFLFDEERWVIRYMEADFGSMFNKKRVLIPRTFMGEPDGQNEKFPVSMSGKDIENCPDLTEELVVSRAYEMELNKHYGIDNYWMYDFSTMGNTMLYPPRPLRIPSRIITEDDLETSLRSFEEVKGYHIKAVDDTMGHIEDIIIDDEDWQIVYAIADTKNWLPWSKKVMLPLDFLNDISYIKQEVSIDLMKDTIKDAPEYDSSKPVEIKEEREMYEFLTRIMLTNNKKKR